ncbi:hypothetical protein RHMOL_Rhmol10G0165700 [Rhododendron molle]|uniref:Uncharacterized protein n=1 Tax=Rhododendron molle TaxID=49168 RepID=A0ACC0M421_RHOML|nr:hypothetical protein RHMOL_Rhmol10G0165700 [Rhododendron molle]
MPRGFSTRGSMGWGLQSGQTPRPLYSSVHHLSRTWASRFMRRINSLEPEKGFRKLRGYCGGLGYQLGNRTMMCGPESGGGSTRNLYK